MPTMRSRREQLMEDIDCIISSRLEDCEGLIATLCDAVIYHFPCDGDETVPDESTGWN